MFCMLVDYYGRCTILYKSSCTVIYLIYLGDLKRTCGIKWKLNKYDGFVNLFTVYMPCDVNTAMHHHDFNDMYCLQNNVEYCINGGDFNADISRVNSMNTTSLQNYISDKGLMFCMKSENCINIDYTYCGHNQFFLYLIILLSQVAYRLRLLFIKQSVP